MTTYALAWFSMLGLRFVTNRHSQAVVYFTLLFFLVLFSGLRWEVGCDWDNYYRHFQLVSDPRFSPWVRPIENGWWLLVDTVQSAGFPYFALNLIVALIFFTCIHFFARRQDDPVGFLIALFPAA